MISKFDEDMNVESSYLCTTTECQCPAGQRPLCRHREMLPKFIHRGAIGSDWFFDYDRGGWVQMYSEEPHSTTVSAPDFDSGDTGSNPVGVAMELMTLPSYHGVTIRQVKEIKSEPAKQPYRKPNDGRRV